MQPVRGVLFVPIPRFKMVELFYVRIFACVLFSAKISHECAVFDFPDKGGCGFILRILVFWSEFIYGGLEQFN